MIEREAPGMSLAMLMGSLNVTPLGMLSRSGRRSTSRDAREGGGGEGKKKSDFIIINRYIVNLLLNLVASFSIKIFAPRQMMRRFF